MSEASNAITVTLASEAWTKHADTSFRLFNNDHKEVARLTQDNIATFDWPAIRDMAQQGEGEPLTGFNMGLGMARFLLAAYEAGREAAVETGC